ncbi:Hypothetical predicted protein [Paramuricea clavata]|uniref:Uncharacterized protein n=1 Tax=Paramuricea clavata TaxID=317549 RepID=A0A6S7J9Y3_PARCT|nr:Hypothetical predicted protein [Paramuricea clavata]
MHHKCKSLEEKNSMLLGKLAALNESIKSRINDHVTIESDLPASGADIPTSNKFLSLSDESIIEEPSHKSSSKQHSVSSNPNNAKNEADTILICDSNGRHLNPPLLSPTAKQAVRTRCATLVRAKSIINSTTYTSPKSFIIDTGTNDLEHSDTNEALIKNAIGTVELIQTKHPESHIIFSFILTRNDELDKRGMTLNNCLEKLLSTKKNFTFVRHSNINSKYHLKDKKHLNDRSEPEARIL